MAISPSAWVHANLSPKGARRGSGSNICTSRLVPRFKRVALRLANQARERKEAEGGAGGLGLSSDEMEDEREIWSVGKVELDDVFGDKS